MERKVHEFVCDYCGMTNPAFSVSMLIGLLPPDWLEVRLARGAHLDLIKHYCPECPKCEVNVRGLFPKETV